MSRSSHVGIAIMVVVALVGIGARSAEAQSCLLAGLDLDGDNLCGNWESGCSASGRTRTDGNDADSDNDTIRDDHEVGGTGSPTSALDTDGDAAGIDGCDLDSDGDGVPDSVEAGDANLATAPINSDGDALPDYRDLDSDNDSLADAAEGTADPDGDALPAYRDPDDDGDGIPTLIEAGDADPLTPPVDTDGDGVRDHLDTDSDGDGNPDLAEGTGDLDGDGIVNYRDADDLDGPLADPDGDGRHNAADNCDRAANADQLDTDGDGDGDACDADDDGDAVADTGDNCPLVANPDQSDSDADGTGDACAGDIDGDGVPNADDGCPLHADADQADLDGDGAGDACDPDDDGDGVADATDNCPTTANLDQYDTDEDGAGNACDGDDDGDGVPDGLDRCPLDHDPGQPDLDGDGAGDACDLDDDGDGLADADDRCPRDASPDQTDTDGDGAGDLCDLDDDDDEVTDADDNCPLVDNGDQADVEGDGLGDACDVADDDGDGVDDTDERDLGTDPRDAADFPRATGGGCSAGDGGVGMALALALLAGLALLRRRLYRRLRAAMLFALAGVVASGVPDAGADGLAAEVLRPAVIGRDGVVVEGSGVLAPFDSQLDLLLGHAANPIELSDGDGERIAGVIDQLSSLHLRASLGLPGRLEAGLHLPVLVARGPAMDGAGSGAGDLTLSLKWAARGRERGGVGVAVWPELVVPTGDEQALRGDGGFGGGLRVAVDRRVGDLVVIGTAGGRFRDGTRAYRFASVGQQLTYGALVGWSPAPAWRLALEGDGAVGVGDAAGTNHAQALASAALAVGPVSVVVGGGAGLNDAVGTPDWRAFAAFAYRYQRPHDLDLDDDGLLDRADRCPSRPEDADGFEDSDGCPDDDNDGDGVADASDRCPLRGEDQDGFEDHDGCPDDDNDADGLADAADACDDRAEDADGFRDDDGCPDDDNDGDGLADLHDRCPLAAETHNQFQDDDGCPDERPTYIFKSGERLVFTNIMFPTDRWDILPQSFPILDEIVRSLQQQPWVRVRIEGHTDDVGKDGKNLVLSQQRALAVVNYLIGAGVDARRLEHAGYGETRPVAANSDPEGRAQNRRVELITLDGAFPVPGDAGAPAQVKP